MVLVSLFFIKVGGTAQFEKFVLQADLWADFIKSEWVNSAISLTIAVLAAEQRWDRTRTAQGVADECAAHRSWVEVPLDLGVHLLKRFDGILSFLEVDLLPFRDWRFFVGRVTRALNLQSQRT
jgi:hypothetical protein